MERFRFVAFALSALLLISPGSLFGQDKVPRFVGGDCPFNPGDWSANVRLECGYLVVARDRQQPSNGTFRLAVAILRSKEPVSSLPLVMIHGGPSGPGGLRAGEMSLASRWAPMLKRDIIVYDQRGAGLSEPKLCPEVPSSRTRMQSQPTPEERQRAFNAFARDCVASLKAEHIDPDTFNTETNAADLKDLRTSLGYPVWDLWGVSYGGRVVQEVLRRDPNGIRAVIMGSPEIGGVAFEAEVPLSYQRAVERVFVSCAEQSSCAAAFPNLEQDFYALVAELDDKPIEVTIDRSNGAVKGTLDGERFLREVHNRFAGQFTHLPLIVQELRRGDRMRMAASLVANSATGSGAGSNVLTDLVGCYDNYGPDYLKAANAIKEKVKPPFRIFVNDIQECLIWHSRVAAVADHALVRSNIPALILTTEFDDRSPTDHGRRIAAELDAAYVFEFPGRGHGELSGDCPESIISQFLQDPTREPDSSCIQAMKIVSFETQPVERPTVFLTVTDTNQSSNRFSGKWEGVFPGAPVEYRITLAMTGAAVAGSIMTAAQKLEIFDGRVDGQTITFKVISPDRDRTITFTGTLNEDQISFSRNVEVRNGGAPGGIALFGASGARVFTTKRMP